MIEGMNILKKIEIVEKELESGWWIPILIGVAAVMIFFIVALLILCEIDKRRKTECESNVLVFCSLIGIGAIILGFSLDAIGEKYVSVTPTGKYAYEVTFDSQDAFYEAYKQYDIAKVDSTYKDIAGKIYTIKER